MLGGRDDGLAGWWGAVVTSNAMPLGVPVKLSVPPAGQLTHGIEEAFIKRG